MPGILGEVSGIPAVTIKGVLSRQRFIDFQLPAQDNLVDSRFGIRICHAALAVTAGNAFIGVRIAHIGGQRGFSPQIGLVRCQYRHLQYLTDITALNGVLHLILICRPGCHPAFTVFLCPFYWLFCSCGICQCNDPFRRGAFLAPDIERTVCGIALFGIKLIDGMQDPLDMQHPFQLQVADARRFVFIKLNYRLLLSVRAIKGGGQCPVTGFLPGGDNHFVYAV
ncbi:hypothetical protein Xvie_04040 [Xenorhabdus vietnamensis]|uniref:Uncharacterized protein n=1 Tax=Xenorhabdus vietnamensis TaxID=351656 RepID=A0A1Y2S624_9GAMM|nr:hypothetical protein Xvie_04040 [Xenorhabdus vietnamensis]